MAICLLSIKSGEFLRIFSKRLYAFPKSCLLAAEPSVFVKQPIKAGTIASVVLTIYAKTKINLLLSLFY